MIAKLVSGGQTGVDRAALDAALDAGIPIGGWCPLGRLAEDGRVPPLYPLVETPTADYAERTEWNARDADGTLVITFGPPEGGTAFTIRMAEKWKRPCLVIDLEQGNESLDAVAWVNNHGIATLNVGGPRGSKGPDVYPLAYEYLSGLLARLA